MKRASVCVLKQSRWRWLCLLAVLLLVGCSSTSAPPKLGHWSNEGGASGEAAVSFDLAGDGKISNFTLSARIQGNKCTINVSQLQMQVQKDGQFSISYSLEGDKLKEAVGAAIMGLLNVSALQVMSLKGRSGDTWMSGSYEIQICNHVVFTSDNSGTWNASWKSP